MKTLEEMKGMSIQDLMDQIDSWKVEYVKDSFEADLQKKVAKPHRFRLLRKQIARARTLIRQKQMEGT